MREQPSGFGRKDRGIWNREPTHTGRQDKDETKETRTTRQTDTGQRKPATTRDDGEADRKPIQTENTQIEEANDCEREGECEEETKVLYWNVAGLNKKDGEFWEFVTRHEIVNQETWVEKRYCDKLENRLPKEYH